MRMRGPNFGDSSPIKDELDDDEIDDDSYKDSRRNPNASFLSKGPNSTIMETTNFSVYPEDIRSRFRAQYRSNNNMVADEGITASGKSLY